MKDDKAIIEFTNLMRGRAVFYNFFSVVFREPLESDRLEFITTSAEYFKMLSEKSEQIELKNGSELLCDFSKKAPEHIHDDKDKLLKELNITFTTLFLLGPYSMRYTESSFLSRAGLWKQEAWEEVKEIYWQNRFAMPENFKNLKTIWLWNCYLCQQWLS